MSTNEQPHDAVFSAFAAAAEALKRVPQLEAEILDQRRDIGEYQQRNSYLHDSLDDREATIAELTAKVASLEEQLSNATFREKEIRDQREVLLAAVRGVVKEMTETSALVDPPVPPTVVEPNSLATEAHVIEPNSLSTFTLESPVNPTIAASGSMTPPIQTGDQTGSGVGGVIGEHRDLTDSGQGQSEVYPTTTSIGKGTTLGSAQAVETTSTTAFATMEVSGNAQSAPFASTTADQYPNAGSDTMKATDSSTTAATSADASHPSAGRAFWNKPIEMSWERWVFTLYGELAPWLEIVDGKILSKDR